jgi:aspartyl-tRNA(Asn)/glutamyl-tRNA(Gln) amidotransferase subunit A
MHIPALDQLAVVNAAGGFAPVEAYAWHRKLLAERRADYDPRVASRIEPGAKMTAADYIGLLQGRRALIASANQTTAPYDAVLMPTVAIVAPKQSELAADADYFRLNGLILRNCALGNFLDRCAATVPIHQPGELPVGLMLMGEHGGDHRLLSVALAVEGAVARPR